MPMAVAKESQCCNRRRFLAFAGAGVLAVPVTARADLVRFFRVASGPLGGTCFPIGGLLANVMSKPDGSWPCERGGLCGAPGVIATAQATAGSVANIAALAAGTMDCALVQADVAEAALTGTGFFHGRRHDRLRAIASLYPEVVHIVVRGDGPIYRLADLKRRTVAIGDDGSGTRVNALALLAAAGVGERQAKLKTMAPSVSEDALVAGEIDAFFFTGGTPVSSISYLADKHAIRFLPVDESVFARIAPRSGAHVPAFIAADSYSGVETDIPTVGTRALLLTDVGQADDIIYAVTSALWSPTQRAFLDGGHPRGRDIRLDTALHALTVPLHPGARRFYEKAGTLTASTASAAPLGREGL